MFTFDPKKKSQIDCGRILRGWHTLSIILRELDTLEDCNALFQYEYANEHRSLMLERLASRAAKIAGQIVKEIMINEAYERCSHRTIRKRHRSIPVQESEIPKGDPI